MNAEPGKPRPIAVIAIHGVADQKPNDTARAAAEMLMRAHEVEPTLRRRKVEGKTEDAQIGVGTYRDFEQRELLVQVSALRTPGDPGALAFTAPVQTEAAPPGLLHGVFNVTQEPNIVADAVHSSNVERGDGGSVAVAVAEPSADEISLGYMQEQLRECVVPENESIYQTIRLEAVRSDAHGNAGPHVHVFEMYWADLSRPVGSWFRWLIEFYQLLFHLCVLGRKSLDFARAEHERAAHEQGLRWAGVWGIFKWAQRIAETSLSIFVPVLNLCLLGLASALLPLMAREDVVHKAVAGVLFIACAAALAAALYRWRTSLIQSGRRWPAWLLAVLAAGTGAAALFYLAQTPGRAMPWALNLWAIAVAAVIIKVLLSYQKTRPGALLYGTIALAAVIIAYGSQIASAGGNVRDLANAVVRTAQLTGLFLMVSWFVILLCAAVASVCGRLILNAVPRQEPAGAAGVAEDRVRRAAWTTNVTLVVPTLVVLLLNLTLWFALIRAAVPERRITTAVTPAAAPAVAAAAATEPAMPAAPAVAAATSSAESAQPAPSAPDERSGWNFVKNSPLWNETFHPLQSTSPFLQKLVSLELPREPKITDAAHALMAKSYTPLYFVLCAAFALAGLILVWSIIPAVMGEVRPRDQGRSPEERNRLSGWLGESLSSGFAAMRGSGEIVRWTILLWVPLLIAVDLLVSTENTWKLRPFNEALLWAGAAVAVGAIASRGPFKGLALGLRSGLDIALDVINWLRLHPRTGNPRARICARYHSLLQHIEGWADPRGGGGYEAIVILAHSQGTIITADLLRYLKAHGMSPKPAIYLFTMGCPLRQLYSLRFPHLYAWARHGDKAWAGREPLPETIDVSRWVNAYRSGDYVGRYLWHPEAGEKLWSTEVVHAHGTKREFCIGAGAHTHYWDESAPEIAVELDRLVGLAASGGPGKP